MDVEWLLKEDPISMRKVNIWIQEVFNYIEQYKKPVIAALNGNTLGAGLILALICDLRLASNNILLGIPEIKIGIPLFLGGPKILQRYLGIGKIKELSFLGSLIDAKKGMELGLIDQITSKEKLEQKSKRIAHDISILSPIALEMLKASLNASYEMSEKALLSYELDSLGFYWGTEDRKEGFESFLEKRKAKFKGT
jgi:enoyl-CoA hydratase/carnithine racemase